MCYTKINNRPVSGISSAIQAAETKKKTRRSREEKEGVRPRRGRQRLPLILDQRASLALWAPPAESVDGTAAFCYNYIAMNMEMYRSGRNENDSKSFCP